MEVRGDCRIKPQALPSGNITHSWVAGLHTTVGERLACLLDLAERGRRRKRRRRRCCRRREEDWGDEGLRLRFGGELDMGHWALRLDGMGCEREEWAEGRSGQSDTFPFSFAGYSLQQRKTTLLCYLLTRVNCRNGRHFRSSVGILHLCKMGDPN